MKMPFGKYKGLDMDVVPSDYLDWLRGQPWLDKFPLVEKYLEDNSASINSELGVDE